MYFSHSLSNNVSIRTAKKPSSRVKWTGTLAGDTFQALHLYLDIFNCGEWYQDAPHFSIPNDLKARFANRFAHDCPADIAKKYHAGKLTPKRVQRGIDRDDQYFTCNKASASGRSLIYLDLDDHQPGQQDKALLTQAVLSFVGTDKLFLNEGRLWAKGCWKDSNYPKFKQVYTAFTEALDSWAVAKGFGTNVDSPKGFNQLGRLPLKNWNYAKLEAFRKTPHVTVAMLEEWTRRLKADMKSGTSHPTNAVIDSTLGVDGEGVLNGSATSIDGDCGENGLLECASAPLPSASPPTTPFRFVAEIATPKAEGRPRLNVCKSLSCLPLTEDEIEDIPARIKRYRSLSYRCMQAAEKHKPKGQNLYSLDVQYALTILDFHFKYANENHGAPVERAEAWWRWMVKEGHFTRGWCGKKWAAIHRMLVDCGVLNVIDNKYWFYAEGGKPGKSQQYHMKEEYLAASCQRGEASIQEVKIEYIPNRCRPCRVSPPEQQSDYWSSPRWQRKLHETLYEVAA